MGKIIKNPLLLFGISGKLGNQVHYSRKGKHYVRSLPKKTDIPPTQAQLAQRARFALATKCLKPARQLIAIGFKAPKAGMTEYNRAASYTHKNAVCGEYPGYYIDFSKLLVSQGGLKKAWNASALRTQPNVTRLRVAGGFKLGRRHPAPQSTPV